MLTRLPMTQSGGMHKLAKANDNKGDIRSSESKILECSNGTPIEGDIFKGSTINKGNTLAEDLEGLAPSIFVLKSKSIIYLDLVR